MRDMEARGHADATNPEGETLRMVADGQAVWLRPDGSECWFQHDDGAICVKNPDEAIFERMKQAAQHFGARVQGDEGEFY